MIRDAFAAVLIVAFIALLIRCDREPMGRRYRVLIPGDTAGFYCNTVPRVPRPITIDTLRP